ncbi:hypothetical protein [Nonomuraea sp. LPB2021202275-12-8]|uniref:hypothetical protein n=1 Tax=Nonomuraea sp. LPB2021202275-12-8 TaxID=3120159 RepID=UPI00300BFC2B
MSTFEIIVGIGGGLLVNEFCDISPWVARKTVVWSVRLKYGRSARAEIRAEEQAAVIDSRPGKLFKLVTALIFAAGATGSYVRREALLLQLLFTSIKIVARVSGPHTATQARRIVERSDLLIGEFHVVKGYNIQDEPSHLRKSQMHNIGSEPSSVDPD